ncbi:MAG: PAS domain S-box protein [Bacteroidales bacterium]|nr:PAS domain S-box protein [Bacteroidales bacterium]
MQYSVFNIQAFSILYQGHSAIIVRHFLFLIFFILYSSFYIQQSFAQTTYEQGLPFIQNYNDKDYHLSTNQTWAILQDQRGVMYFGNTNGILEFDGTNWRLIEIPNKSSVRSMGMDSKGRIYVGAKSEFGYIEADTTGTMQYISLLGKVPEKHRNFEDVWETFVLNKQVVFRTNYSIYILKDNKINILKSCNKFHAGFCVNNQFYVREWEKGLLSLINDSLKIVPQSEQFANERIYAMLPYENNKILIATRTKGIFIYTKNMGFIKPKGFKDVDNFLIKNHIYCGAKLNNDFFILSTIQGGIIIIDKYGSITRYINKKSGLQDNTILSIYTDSQKNIWAGLNNGISYIIINSPFTFYNEKNGLNSTVNTAIVFQNRLFAGTYLGLFCKDQENNFIMLRNTKGTCWFLDEIKNKLYCAHYEGILKINEDITKNIAAIGTTWNFTEFSGHNGFVIAGTKNGLTLLEHKNGKLTLKHKIKGFDESSRYIQQDSLGNIWISHLNKGVYRLKLSEYLDSLTEMNFYNSENGLPANTNNFVFKIIEKNQSSSIVFGTEKGIYQYNSHTNQFIPDEKFNILLNNKGFIDKFVQDDKGNIYFQQGYEKGVLLLQTDGTYKLERTPFLKFKGLYIENISIIDTTTILFCSKDGIIHYNSSIKSDFDISYPTLIRHVFANDSLIFGGAKIISNVIKLPYKLNALKFAYSALFYEDHDKTQYSYYLKGFDPEYSGWSEWSIKTEKEYTNLHEGNYCFKVKAKNIFDVISNEAVYRFTIYPPWYRTIYMYIIYGLLFIFLLFICIKLYTRRLKAANIRLENIVTKRTAEISQQKEEIQSQAEHLAHVNIELEKLSIVASKTDNAVMIMDPEGNFEWINEGLTRMYGLTYEQLINERSANIIDSSENPDIKDFINTCRENKKTIVYESLTTSKSGKKIWAQTTLTPILDFDGNIIKLVAIDTDISKIKQAEEKIKQQKEELQTTLENLRKTQKQLIESKKMASLGSLVAGIAHEINTPLGIGIAASSTLIKKTKQMAELFEKKKISLSELNSFIESSKTASELIFTNLERTGELVESFKQVSVDQSSENQRQFNLKLYLEDVIKSLHPKLTEKSIQLEIDCNENLELNSYPGVFAQIITNFVINSLKHGFVDKMNGKIIITAISQNDTLVLEYKDNGIGISQEIIHKIFDPFFTTNMQKGTGLGLHIIYNLVTQKLKGVVHCKSEIGKGATFIIIIPLT